MTTVTRIGSVAGVGGIALALSRVVGLVEPTPEMPSVSATLFVATVIGVGIAVASRAARLGSMAQVAAIGVGSMLAFARLAAPATLAGGLLPTSATPSAMGGELTVAMELIRFGNAPVVASAGLVGVLAIVFIVLGALLVSGISAGRPLLATVPSISFYLLCATLDRRPPAGWSPIALIALGAIAFLGEGLRAHGGRARLRSSGRPLPTHNWAMPVLMVALVTAAGTFSVNRWAAAVPESGVVAWRNPTGFGGGLFAGFSYNLLADMQQDLASESQEILFVARVSDAAPPNRDLYWRLITLDTFDGKYWLPGSLSIKRPSSPRDWEAPDFAFRGQTVAVESVVRIDQLRMNYLPVLYSPRNLVTDDRLLAQSHRSREDGSVKFDARSQEGLVYRVRSEIPVPDLSVLATENGELSPMFQNAQSEGIFTLPSTQIEKPLASPRIQSDYTDLPSEFSDIISALSRQITEQATTDFEQGLIIEQFFRTNGGFVYDASASTGHSVLVLEEWLLDPESRNYRRGYCEQFAAAMGIMARAIGIPARLVLGFSPGTVQNQPDGSELIVVRARNAHVWVELFMAGQGWIRFDPTPRADGTNPATAGELGFDPIAFLPEPADPTQTASALPGSVDALDRRFLEEGADPTLGFRLPSRNSSRPLWVFLVVLAIVCLIPGLKAIRRGFRLQRLGAGDLSAGWSELTDRLQDLGMRVSPALTPVEVAAAIDPGIAPLANRLTAAVYGSRQINDGQSALRLAESALRNRHSRGRWLLGWLHPETLLSGLGQSIRRWRPVRRSRPTRPVAEK